MNTTTFIINTQTTALIDQLKANKVPMVEDNGKYMAVVSVCKELDLFYLICEIARKIKATADIELYYQDGSGLDQCVHSIHFVNGLDEWDLDELMEKENDKSATNRVVDARED